MTRAYYAMGRRRGMRGSRVRHLRRPVLRRLEWLEESQSSRMPDLGLNLDFAQMSLGIN
jgi:hypothetical protein